MGLVCLGRDANVDGDPATVEYGVGDNVPGSESRRVAEGFLPGRGGVNGFGHGCDGTHDAVVSSGGLRCRAAACVCASDVEEFAAAIACGCFRKESAAKPVADGVFVDVWWQDGAFRLVNVVNPLVVGLGVPEFVNAFYVIYGFLVELFLVEESGSCVVCELAQKVLGFVGIAGCFVVRV